MTPRGGGALCLLAVLGCADPVDTAIPEEGTALRVDCLGMIPIADRQDFNPGKYGTPALLFDDQGPIEGRRCEGWPTQGFVGKQPGETFDGGAFSLRLGGRRWQASEWTIEVEQTVSDWYALGAYTGTFVDVENQEVATATGWIDFCDQQLHPECPYTIENILPYRFETAHEVLPAWGEASHCRAVLDPTTEGLQIDVQTAVWNGINISQLYRTSCPQHEDINPDWYGNRLTFKAGGVTGPGSYGPYRVTDFGGTQLPSLEWTVPAIFAAQSNRVTMQDFYQVCGDPDPYRFTTMDWTSEDTEVGVDSTCTFELGPGSPATVWIECSEVITDRLVPGQSPCTNPNIGCAADCSFQDGTCGRRFQWSGQCDVVTR